MEILASHLCMVLLVVGGLQGSVYGKSLVEDERELLVKLLVEKMQEENTENELDEFERGADDCYNGVCIMKSGSIRGECLKAHNVVRQYHKVGDLKWAKTPKDELTPDEWAEMLAATNTFKHDEETEWGENIFMTGYLGDKPELPCAEGVRSWYSEVKDYKKPGFSPNTGHFTQLVWKDTTKLNCGVAYNTATKVSITVCRYYVRGNFGDTYQENVIPTDLNLYRELLTGVTPLL